jgi:uncharacterized phage-associated protein
MNKLDASKYILLRLCDWYFEVNPLKRESKQNDLSILKVLKLIFLLSPIEYNGNKLLDYQFEFEAWALGPVEVDIYNSKNLLNIDLVHKKINYDQLKNSLDEIDIESNDKMFLNNIVEILKSKNKYLINLSATQLVNLTHKYSSWITSYNCTHSTSMEKDLIIKEEKFYFI